MLNRRGNFPYFSIYRESIVKVEFSFISSSFYRNLKAIGKGFEDSILLVLSLNYLLSAAGEGDAILLGFFELFFRFFFFIFGFTTSMDLNADS